MKKKLNDPSYASDLAANNQLQKDIADLLWQWYRYGKPGDGYAPYISYTSGFRPANYPDDVVDEEGNPYFIYAVKSYPMNVNITYGVMDELLRLVLEARDAIEAGNGPNNYDDAGACPIPYSKFNQINPVECASDNTCEGPATSDNLLSGIGRQSLKSLKRFRKRRKK